MFNLTPHITWGLYTFTDRQDFLHRMLAWKTMLTILIISLRTQFRITAVYFSHKTSKHSVIYTALSARYCQHNGWRARAG